MPVKTGEEGAMAGAKKTGKSGKKKRRRGGSGSQSAARGGELLTPRFSRFDTERINRKIAKLVEGENFSDMDELDSFINRAMSEGVLDAGSSGPAGMDEPVEQAQELAFQAMEEPDDRKALELARMALKLDPECIDARSVELQITVDDPQERAKAFQLMLKQARKAMGKEFFEENKGQFWGVVTTRPYMRALEYLADLLVSLERFDEAIAVYEEMIDLNSEDNQGARDSLLGLYLGEGDVLKARSLLNRYLKDDLAVFSWGRAIERFLSGDMAEAREALKRAVRANAFVLAIMAGIEDMPEDYDGGFSPGDINEAWYCLMELGPVWEKQPDVLPWIASEMPRLIES